MSTTTTVSRFRLVNPTDLIIGANARTDPRPDDAEFLASVAERGVIEPIICYETEAGKLVVSRGQRRTLAAVKSGTPLVPVVVIDEPDEVDRLVDQVTENLHRADLSVHETAAAYQQLAAFGLPAQEIARKMARPRHEVDAALKIAANPAAAAAVAQYPLTLTQGAVLAEFDGDDDATSRLVDAAQRGGFDHAAQVLRDERAQRAQRDALIAELTAKGVTVTSDPTQATWEYQLRWLGDGAGGELTEQAHAGCPGAAVALVKRWEDGQHTWAQVAVCLDPKKYGHPDRNGADNRPRDPDAEAAAAAAEAERELVDANNAAWESARAVRREWLAEFLQRKVPPPRAAAFVVESLVMGGPSAAVMETVDCVQLLHELLDVEVPEDWDSPSEIALRVLPAASDRRALVLAVGLVLCCYESETPARHWQHPNAGTRRYLRYIEQLGYELSEVEQLACAEPEQDTDGDDEGGDA